MHVLFNLATLAVECVMYDCHEMTAAHNRTLPNHVEHDERLSHEEIEVVMVDGKPTVRRRQPMAISAPAQLKVGVEVPFGGIPAGVAITVNDAPAGVMDASGVLEFTAQVAGFYRFHFEGSGWIMKEITVEAVA